jgi:hypothetical protein
MSAYFAETKEVIIGFRANLLYKGSYQKVIAILQYSSTPKPPDMFTGKAIEL